MKNLSCLEYKGYEFIFYDYIYFGSAKDGFKKNGLNDMILDTFSDCCIYTILDNIIECDINDIKYSLGKDERKFISLIEKYEKYQY